MYASAPGVARRASYADRRSPGPGTVRRAVPVGQIEMRDTLVEGAGRSAAAARGVRGDPAETARTRPFGACQLEASGTVSDPGRVVRRRCERRLEYAARTRE